MRHHPFKGATRVRIPGASSSPRLSEQRLEPIASEAGRDFTVADFPRANHALVETTTGLTAEMLRSDTFAPGLFARVGDWLRAHRLAG
jgi:hypothetical protein